MQKALIAAILGLGLQLTVLAAVPFVRTLASYPLARLDLFSLLQAAAVALFPGLTLILFFAALLRELSTRSNNGVRRSAAILAVVGQAVQFLSFLWSAVRFQPYDPVRHWIFTAIFQLTPSLLWIALLLVFWPDADPTANRLTRPLVAAVLFFVEVAIVLRGSYSIVQRFSRMVESAGRGVWGVPIGPAAFILGGASLAFLLFAIYRSARSVL
jgi:hypothetical protein